MRKIEFEKFDIYLLNDNWRTVKFKPSKKYIEHFCANQYIIAIKKEIKQNELISVSLEENLNIHILKSYLNVYTVKGIASQFFNDPNLYFEDNEKREENLKYFLITSFNFSERSFSSSKMIYQHNENYDCYIANHLGERFCSLEIKSYKGMSFNFFLKTYHTHYFPIYLTQHIINNNEYDLSRYNINPQLVGMNNAEKIYTTEFFNFMVNV